MWMRCSVNRAIDVIHVCTPNNTHVPLARKALEAGKHVVVEKPIATRPRRGRCDCSPQPPGRSGMRWSRSPTAATPWSDVPDPRWPTASWVISGLSAAPTSRTGSRTRQTTTGGWTPASADDPARWPTSAPIGSTRRSSSPGLRVEAVLADLATFIRTRSRSVGGTIAFSAAEGPVEAVEIESEDAATFLLSLRGRRPRVMRCVSQVSTGHKNAFSLNVDGLPPVPLLGPGAAGAALAPRARGGASPGARSRRRAGGGRRSVAAGWPPGGLGRSAPRPAATVLRGCGIREARRQARTSRTRRSRSERGALPSSRPHWNRRPPAAWVPLPDEVSRHDGPPDQSTSDATRPTSAGTAR